jgi:hypothetical protein
MPDLDTPAVTGAVEYGCRLIEDDGVVAIVQTQRPGDLDQAVSLVGAARQAQRRVGGIAHAHLVCRHLDRDGRPVDEWQAAPNPTHTLDETSGEST